MRLLLKKITAAICAICFFYGSACIAETGFRSQVSAWSTANEDNLQVGMRYIPEVSFSKRISGYKELSAEAAVNAFWHSNYHDFSHAGSRGEIDPYRLWLRYSDSQYEIRAGLQKINFGSATLLRPLRWFDAVDPRDPLKLTAGVYGILGRYYLLNNTNLWVWALTNNDKRKGWETLPSSKQRYEFGGRVQVPVHAGEMGLSFHQRRVNVPARQVSSFFPRSGDFYERTVGLDGKWDVGVGLWFEGSLTRQNYREAAARYKSLVTIGSDYTFPVGGGLHVLCEELMSVEARQPFGGGRTSFMTGLSVGYPLSLFDRLSTIVYFEQKRNEWSKFITWQRTYDQWQIHLSAFWNPEAVSSLQTEQAVNTYAGKGLQLMLVYNN